MVSCYHRIIIHGCVVLLMKRAKGVSIFVWYNPNLCESTRSVWSHPLARWFFFSALFRRISAYYLSKKKLECHLWFNVWSHQAFEIDSFKMRKKNECVFRKCNKKVFFWKRLPTLAIDRIKTGISFTFVWKYQTFFGL